MARRGKVGLRLCEGAAQLTEQVGRALLLPVDRARLRRLEAALSPPLAVWSIRVAPTPGARVVLGGPELDATARALELEGDPQLQRLHHMLRLGGEAGLGLSLGPTGTALRPTEADALRYYRVAPPGEGYELYLCAREALPAYTDDAVALARICGGDRCAALNAVSTAEGIEELTLYFAVKDAPTLLRVLELAMLPVSARANLFFKGVLGLEPGGERPWPKLWVARSRAGGWRFLYLARGDTHRRTDAVLLDATDANELTWAARDVLLGAVDLPTGPGAAVQGLGLRFEVDQTHPDWVLYLSPLDVL